MKPWILMVLAGLTPTAISSQAQPSSSPSNTAPLSAAHVRVRQSLLKALVLVCLIVALIWPALWNRGPFFFPDTRAYIRGADAAINKLTHWTTAWTAPEDDITTAARSETAQNAEKGLSETNEGRTRSLKEIAKRGILMGRSPYYGALLYAGAIAGGFWLTILIQAGVVLLSSFLVLRALGYPVWPNLAYLGMGLCLLSDAPFFASYLMPDLFAGIAILASAVLLSTSARLARKDFALWYLLLSAAMLFHDTCTAISASLFALAIVVNLIRRSWTNWRGLCVILFAAITGYTGQSLVACGVTRMTGQAPLRIPFLSASLVANGPGADYLRATCPESHFTLCKSVAKFPVSDSDFLWGTQPEKMVWGASYDKRRAISEEQFRFAFAVLKYDPIGVMKVSANNSVLQLFDFRLREFEYGPFFKDLMDRTLPLPVLAQVRSSAAYRGKMPVEILSVILYLFVFGSLTFILFVLFARRWKGAVDHGLKRIFCWISAGIVVNAVICGSISGIYSRYGARVIWLVPMIALLAALQVCKGWETVTLRNSSTNPCFPISNS
jgi:hypothetical protein